MEREKKDAAVGDGQGGRGGRQRPARHARGGDGEEGKSRDGRGDPGDGEGESVDAREQIRGLRTNVIEFTAGETVVVASEITGPHASRGGGSREAECASKPRDANFFRTLQRPLERAFRNLEKLRDSKMWVGQLETTRLEKGENKSTRARGRALASRARASRGYEM